MKPISPVLPADILGFNEVMYAKDQPQYRQLPAIKLSDGGVLTRWKMNWLDRLRVLFTGSVYLEVMTFHRPLQPLRMGTTALEALGYDQTQKLTAVLDVESST